MGSRRLTRLEGLDPGMVERLAKNKVITCQDFLSRVPIELMELGNIGEPHIGNSIQLVCNAVAPTCIRVSAMQAGRFMPTMLPGLDCALQGGIPRGTITELVGPSGCGKTQFCLQACAAGVLSGAAAGDDSGTVLYIDTEGAFRPDRLVQIARARYPDLLPDEDAVQRLTQRVLIYNVSTSRELVETLQGLEEVIIAHGVRLVLVDSVASVMRKDFDGRASGRERSELLVLEATLLKYIGEEFGIPVIVTNHITTKFGAAGHGEEDSITTAALGNTWSHSVNTRLIIEYAPGNMRRVRVAKSPIAPYCSVLCRIEAAGLVECGDVCTGAEDGESALKLAARTAMDDYQEYNTGQL